MTEDGHEEGGTHENKACAPQAAWPRVTQWTMFGLFGIDLSTPDEKWMRRRRSVRLIGLFVAIVAYFPLAILLVYFTEWCTDFLWGTGDGLTRIGKWIGSEMVALCILFIVPMLIAYFLSRAVFMLIAFRLTLVRGRCRECLYDLAGNVSGVCPECGTRITAS